MRLDFTVGNWFYKQTIYNFRISLPLFVFKSFVTVSDSVALFIDTRPCIRYEAKKSQYNFSINGNGNFWIYERRIWKEYKVDDLMYCMETKFNLSTGRSTSVFKLCAINNANAIKFVFSIPAMITSCICLLITILTYLLVYRLKKKIEIIIVCYCFFLMLYYVLITLTHMVRNLGKYCEIVGITICL